MGISYHTPQPYVKRAHETAASDREIPRGTSDAALRYIQSERSHRLTFRTTCP